MLYLLDIGLNYQEKDAIKELRTASSSSFVNSHKDSMSAYCNKQDSFRDILLVLSRLYEDFCLYITGDQPVEYQFG